MRSLTDLAADLETGRATARGLVEECLARIADPVGEGSRAFLRVHADQARAAADAMDVLRRAGRAPSPYAGVPVSLKDLFDIAGEPTPAGSRVLANAAPATTHAVAVRRLLAAGFVPVGRTNMTEFAYSGLGMNPHYGTPLSPWDRVTGRVPGGSSSGAAVSVADGMAAVAIGTDTGGSCRIPAAFCGITGFKPTARRVPRAGVLPLSTSLDSVGPLGLSVACCAIADAVLAGEADLPARVLDPAPVAGLRLAAPENVVLEGLDAETGAAYEAALRRLAAQGARIERRRFPAFDRILAANARGGLVTAEAFTWHRALLEAEGEAYDPRVRVRLQQGERMSAADYIALRAARAEIRREMDAASAAYDALVMPTVPIVPPALAALAADDAYARANALVLRNPALINFLDRCAISLPCHAAGAPPAGLMLVGETMGDRRLLAVAATVEQALRRV
jgi:aspartyl-tRNA(Asn)/glutamyl-tRNA(Gln) amidotransferase subunit A